MLYNYSISDPQQLILRNFPLERALICAAYFILGTGYLKREKTRSATEVQGAGALLILMVVAALSFLFMMALRSTPGDQRSALSERYFLYLTPLSIFATVLFSRELLCSIRGKRGLKAALIFIFVGLVSSQFLSTYKDIFVKQLLASPFVLPPENVDAQARLLTLNHYIPNNFDYLLAFADKKVKYDQQQFEVYAQYYGKIAEYLPQRADAWGMRGYCLYHLNKPVEAVMAFQRAVSINPQFFEFHYNLGTIYFKLGHYRQAADSLKKAILANPKATLFYMMSSREIYWPLLKEQGGEADGGSALERQLQLSYRYARILLIQSYLNLGDLPQALRYAQDGIRSAGSDKAIFYYFAGLTYYGQKNYPQAIQSLNQSIQLDPQFPDGYYHLGLALKAGGQEDIAAKVFQKGKSLAETNPLPQPEEEIDLRIF